MVLDGWNFNFDVPWKDKERLAHQELFEKIIDEDEEQRKIAKDLFYWDRITKDEMDTFIKFLKKYNINLDNLADFNINDDGKIISFISEKVEICLKLMNEGTSAFLIIDGIKTDEFFVNKENGKRYIYQTKTLKEHIEGVVDFMNILLNYKELKITDQKHPNYNQIIDQLLNHYQFKLIGNIINKINTKSKKDILLYTALYHDIGKIVVKARHGPIGADIIKDSGEPERKRFYDSGFKTHDEILLMSDLIRFHDYFGTLQTGEASYSLFVEVLYPVTNYSLSIKEYKDDFLDYLFLICVADVFSSINQDYIKEVFSIMSHDYHIIKETDKEIGNKNKYIQKNEQNDFDDIVSKDFNDIIEILKSKSEYHTYERLRRLLRSGFNRVDKRSLEKYKQLAITIFPEEKNKYSKGVFLVNDWFKRFSEDNINDISPIMACLRAINVKKEFYSEFALVCKIDYGLGFITEFLRELIKAELIKAEMKNILLQYFEKMEIQDDIVKNEIKKVGVLQTPHNLRRDLAMTVVELINNIIETYGKSTSGETRIGIGLERLSNISDKEREKIINRFKGEKGVFKKAEAYSRIRTDFNFWAIKS